eukprot:2185790-Amphidinium_carterae.1
MEGSRPTPKSANACIISLIVMCALFALQKDARMHLNSCLCTAWIKFNMVIRVFLPPYERSWSKKGTQKEPTHKISMELEAKGEGNGVPGKQHRGTLCCMLRAAGVYGCPSKLFCGSAIPKESLLFKKRLS